MSTWYKRISFFPSRIFISKYSPSFYHFAIFAIIIGRILISMNFQSIGKATGDVLLNGKPIDTGQMIRISGFVPQTDLAVESLTILEHMEFMVRSITML